MRDGIAFFGNSMLSASRAGALGRAVQLVRRWIALPRRRQSLAELDDWILRDVGVIRERDMGAGVEDPREAASRFWPN